MQLLKRTSHTHTHTHTHTHMDLGKCTGLKNQIAEQHSDPIYMYSLIQSTFKKIQNVHMYGCVCTDSFWKDICKLNNGPF